MEKILLIVPAEGLYTIQYTVVNFIHVVNVLVIVTAPLALIAPQIM